MWLVHKNTTIERREICRWNLPRGVGWYRSSGLSQSTQMAGAYTSSFVESPIICCENFAAFAAYTIGFITMCMQDMSCGGRSHKYSWISFAAWFSCAFTSFFAILTTVGASPFTFAFTTPMPYPPSPQCLKLIDTKRWSAHVFPACLSGSRKESPISLAIRDLGGPHITRVGGWRSARHRLRF